jgi:polyvinyl alcohol dehydrogenase (cytochrome)
MLKLFTHTRAIAISSRYSALMTSLLTVLATVALTIAQPAIAQTPLERAQTAMNTPHPGKAIYDKVCAACHNNPEATRSPALDTLKAMRFQALYYALTQGKMQTQAASLSDEEKSSVIEFLVGREVASDEWIAKMTCPADRGKAELKQIATVATFGYDKRNSRHLTAAQAGLATKDFANLELAWAIGFPGATTMRAQPAVVGSTLFLPVADANRMFAFDIAGTPCVKWVFQNDAPLRTSAAFGELPGSKRKVVVFGDLAANLHMLDAQTGKEIWKQHIGLYEFSLSTGTPVLHNDRVYAPVSQYEITLGADPKHECCKTHGAVIALDAKTGKKIWTAHTMEEAKPLRDRGDGQMYWGPSGAPIWNSPSIDEKRGQLYVGTGEATSEPAHKHTDSILAIALKDGAIRWAHQATADDIFLSGCRPGSKGLNCPLAKTVSRDVDFGASTILAKRADGKDLVIAGQKAGTLWAFDPDNGNVVWKQEFGNGSPLGGIHWGIAFDGERVYAPINRPYGGRPEGVATQKPGLHAVNINTGEVAWAFVAEPDCTGDRQTRVKSCASNIGLSGAPSVIDGAVVEGSLDGFIRAFDAKTGAVLFSFDTAREFTTVNGVKGAGGAIDAVSIVAANGYLFVSSGYGMFGQMPGNVLLAFKPKTAK